MLLASKAVVGLNTLFKIHRNDAQTNKLTRFDRLGNEALSFAHRLRAAASLRSAIIAMPESPSLFSEQSVENVQMQVQMRMQIVIRRQLAYARES